METFALLTCIEGPQATTLLSKVRTGLQNLIFRLYTKSKKRFVVGKIDIGHMHTFYTIALPYSLNQLMKLKRKSYQKLDRIISIICQENFINFCILPDKIKNVWVFQSCRCFENPGQYLYRSLLPNMIDDLYTQMGFVTESIDITIIHGNDIPLTKAFITLLLPRVKFLTLISSGESELTNMIRDVSDDSGLSIRTTESIESGLKTADLIINLKNFSDFHPPFFSSNKSAIIINFGSLEKAMPFFGGRQLIQGIEIEFPEFLIKTIPSPLFSYYNKIELAEIILSYMTNTYNQTLLEFYEPAIMEKISTRFLHDRYAITGYVGKYSIMKKEGILSVYNRKVNK